MSNVEGLAPDRRRWAVLAVAMAVGMAVLDSSITNIALPRIARDLGADPADVVWVVNAYQLAVTISLLPLSSLGDIFGYKRVYLSGLAVFTLASVASATADSLTMLILARIAQGFGGAGIMSVNTALIRYIFPPAQLGRGVGVNALVVATAAAAGPTVASAILAAGPWQWLFRINLPVGAAALALGLKALPRTPGSRHAFDLPSAALSALTFGLLINGIDNLGQRPIAFALEFGGALLFGFFFVRLQLSLRFPMLALDLFRRPAFALSVATAIFSFIAQALAFVSLPFYLQEALGRSQVETGLLITPWPLAIAVVAPIAGRLSDRYSAGLLGGSGLLLMSAGLLSLALLPADAGFLNTAWRMALCGAGFGLFQAPNNRAILSSAPLERSGSASGILSTSRVLGQTTGTAAVGLIFSLFSGAVSGAAIFALFLASGFAMAAALASASRLLSTR